ncbi:hypothetical protein A4V04_04240 [Burkholderiales bacterium YL45]|uniref:Uncharacterized protein n=1 Tax=Turicimonas muris TaxID=1796652 RepID=A0A227KDU7_9BURK|nr:hypothetical protein A4V04_04240 [Burkholderiales bacterium YL45]OXE45472.1 hypothetical protein ADH67_11085 [Turicimonas muris]
MDTSDPNFSSAKAEMLRWQLFFLLSKCTVKEQKRFLCFKFGAKWFASIWFQYLKEFLQKNPKRRKALLSQGFADFSQVLEKLD